MNKLNFDRQDVWYLDFEGNKAGEIFLAGILHSGNFRQVVLDQRLSGLALHHSMEVKTPIDFIDEIVREVQKSNGAIAAYSSAEKNTIEEIYAGNARELPIYNYCNLHTAAKKWVKRYMKKEFAALPPLKKTATKFEAKRLPYSLASIMRLLGHNAPADYAIGKTTKRINAIVAGLKAKKGIYQNLTTTQKGQATKLLKHNDFDVVSLPVLMEEIASKDLALFSKSGWVPTESAAPLAVSYEPPAKDAELKFIPECQSESELAKIREKSPNAYKRWSNKEENRMIKLFNDGWGLQEISRALGRQIGGVRSRLIQLELIDPDDNSELRSSN